MSDRFEQWSRAKLGAYEYLPVGDEPHCELWVTVLVPVDNHDHDPRADVIALVTADRDRVREAGRMIGAEIREHLDAEPVDPAPLVDAEKPPTTRHRKTRGK